MSTSNDYISKILNNVGYPLEGLGEKLNTSLGPKYIFHSELLFISVGTSVTKDKYIYLYAYIYF